MGANNMLGLILAFIFGFMVGAIMMLIEHDKELEKMKLDTAKEIDFSFAVHSDCNRICNGRKYLKVKFLGEKTDNI
jgi:hypothetical protein